MRKKSLKKLTEVREYLRLCQAVLSQLLEIVLEIVDRSFAFRFLGDGGIKTF